jgi:hypothetical protein
VGDGRHLDAVLVKSRLKPLHAALAVLLIGVAAVIAHFHVMGQVYHPVSKVAAPEGLTYLAVQLPTAARQACGEANNRFLAPIKESCKDCKVEFARCERELEGLEDKLLNRQPMPHYQVVSPGLRMAIIGQADKAKAACDVIAGMMAQQGLRPAACVEPAG